MGPAKKGIDMWSTRALCAVGFALFVALPFLPVPGVWIEQINYIGLYALAVIGLVLLTGIAGYLSMGQAPFMGVAAYASAWVCLAYGLSPWLALPLSLMVTSAIAWFLGQVTLKMSGHYLPLATIAWGIALYYLFGSSEALGGHDGMSGVPPISLLGKTLVDAQSIYWLILCAVFLTLWGCHNLLDSQPGRAVRALKSGTRMPEAMGVNTWRVKVAVFVLAAVIAGLAGWLYAHMLRGVSPEPFSLLQSVDFIVMLVVGGMTHLGGAILGAAIVVVLKEQLKVVLPYLFGDSGHAEVVVFGVSVLLCLRFAPEGLWPVLRRLLPCRTRGSLADAPALPHRSAPVAVQPLLQVKDLRKSFGGLTAVNGVSLKVAAGEIVGLIGPNGAGKSTTFSLITGQLAPSGGEILLGGRPIAGLSPSDIAKLGVSRTFQHVKLVPDMTVLENVALGAYLRAKVGFVQAMLRLDRSIERQLLKEAERALQRVGLQDLLHQPAGSLALGQQRLVEIARALCSDPELLLLDEPAAGLRALEKRALAELLVQLRNEGIAVLLVEHDMEFVMQLTDHLVVMVFGSKIAEGRPEGIQQDEAVLNAYLGEAI